MAQPKDRSGSDKKTNAAHPLFAFRTFSPAHKQKLSALVDEAYEIISSNAPADQPRPTKHKMIADVLGDGLQAIIDKGARKKPRGR